ncbi:hypothetical protein OPT61_g2420 [Boeremia exigua]|uniref:Uncharacterized protein n=1 Tax=Boeremia exigua TaxID=749465 RepID=A0ACC2ILK4_9PLEO|nr:hypothetical protein OPT61_g2420 [Boeremia exigua]
MFCYMEPPIERPICQIITRRWSLGSMMICEAVKEVPTDALAGWEDKAGVKYCVRELPGLKDATSHPADGLYHQSGTSAAVWTIGGGFIKVKAWRDDMQLESDTIRFVNGRTEIPTPVVIHSWIDREYDRSFLIVEAVEGVTLDQAWSTMPPDTQVHVAQEVANYCKALSSATSNRLETSDGKGVVEPFLTRPHNDEPSWKPQLLGPYTAEELSAYLGGEFLVGFESEEFLYYHADLDPKNIIINDRGQVVAILDWESAAFYPSFWLGTKPMASPGFSLSAGERNSWAKHLTAALEVKGFPRNHSMFLSWRNSISR